VILDENGGIIDDAVITKHAPDAFYVVANAGCRERDLLWFEMNGVRANGPVELEALDG